MSCSLVSGSNLLNPLKPNVRGLSNVLLRPLPSKICHDAIAQIFPDKPTPLSHHRFDVAGNSSPEDAIAQLFHFIIRLAKLCQQFCFQLGATQHCRGTASENL
jgi:hypothetical protein